MEVTPSAGNDRWAVAQAGPFRQLEWLGVEHGVLRRERRAQSFPSPPMTTLGTTPVSRDVPYLYVDSSGNYHVFAPSLRTNGPGPSWNSGPTPGTSIPMSQFFVATPSNTAAQINAALLTQPSPTRSA